MSRFKKTSLSRYLVLFVVLAMAAAACGNDAGEETTTTSADVETTTTTTNGETTTTVEEPADVWGEPETTEIVFANRLPNITSNTTQVIAEVNGYAAEEGLEIQTVIVEDVRAALVGGSVQVASLEPANMMQARAEGIDLVAIAGHRCNSNTTIAIQPDIESPEGLAGMDVLIGGVPGTPDADFRLGLLALNGWDLREVEGINYVTVPGGSNAWTELFWNGDLAVTPFFARHYEPMVEYGANIVVDTRLEWPDDFYVTTREFAENNPNTIGRLVRALMDSQIYWLAEENAEDVLNKMDAEGFEATEEERAGFEPQKLSFCENMYVDEELTARSMRASGFPDEDIDPISEWGFLDGLFAAQEEFGLDNSPGPYVQEVPGLD